MVSLSVYCMGHPSVSQSVSQWGSGGGGAFCPSKINLGIEAQFRENWGWKMEKRSRILFRLPQSSVGRHYRNTKIVSLLVGRTLSISNRFKGIDARDFWKKKFFINLTHLGTWSSGFLGFRIHKNVQNSNIVSFQRALDENRWRDLKPRARARTSQSGRPLRGPTWTIGDNTQSKQVIK